MTRLLPLAGLLLLLCACANTDTKPTPPTPKAAAKANKGVHVTILQFADVYEITALDGGKWGGLARLATVKKQLLAKNPDTLTLLAGDFFSPSAIGTAKVDGKRLAGKQMVDVLNAVGIDIATFGNHEFDVSKDDFFARLKESQFTWVCANVTNPDGTAYPGVLENKVLTYKQGDNELRIGIFGVCLDANPRDYVRYGEVFKAAKAQVKALKDKCDFLLALTHLSIDQDTRLAQEVPEIDLIVGGHEHENILLRRGKDLTPIVKADANVRSVYVHELHFDPKTKKHRLETRFVPLDESVTPDPAVQKRAQAWVDKAFVGFRKSGFEPTNKVTTVTDALDGREAPVRNGPTKLTEIITSAMAKEWKEAELSIFNTGSIRIDDVIAPGPLTEYDVIRILPFGGATNSIKISGALLRQVFAAGLKNKGNGGFLQYTGATQDPQKGWLIAGQPLDDSKTYKAVIAGYLLTGNELNLGFLNSKAKGLEVVKTNRDIRKAFIEELKRRYQ